MADRVAFIRGSTVNRDFFGWRMDDIAKRATDTIVQANGTTQAAAKYFPLGLTRDEMVKLSWRIKTFTIQGALNYQSLINTSPGTATVNHVWTIQTSWVSHPMQIATEAQSPSFPNQVIIGDATREYDLVGPPNPNLIEFFLSGGLWQPTGSPPSYASGRYLAYQAASATPFGNLGFMAADAMNFLSQIYSPLPPSAITTATLTPSWCFYTFGPGGVNLGPTINSNDPGIGNNGCTTAFIIMGQSPQGHNDGKVPQGQVYYDSVNDLFYPFIFFSMAGFDTIGGCSFEGAGAFASVGISTVDMSGSDPTIGNLTIFGHNITLYVNFTQIDLATISVTPQTSNFTLTPKEYWPFKNNAGNPVYDTSTGTQINDPFG